MKKSEIYCNKIIFRIDHTGMTMTEAGDRLSHEYGWKRSAPGISGKLRHGSLIYGGTAEPSDVLQYGIVRQKRRA